jgi:peptidoglycan/LPS O-acetylase OafA/YrhL
MQTRPPVTPVVTEQLREQADTGSQAAISRHGVEAPRPNPLPALTGIRFFFALGVVLFHQLPSFSPEDLAQLPQWLLNFLATGYIGVSFFFVLSGFILGHTYARARRLDLRAFYVARFARVYPLFLFSLGIYLPFALLMMFHKSVRKK